MMMMMKIDDNHDKMMMMMIVLNENNEEQRRRHGQWAGLRVSRKPLLKTGSMGAGPPRIARPLACTLNVVEGKQ